VPEPYPEEFRQDVVRVARSRPDGVTLEQIAADGIPVTVTCRVLKLARQPYYRWLARPATHAEWIQAHRANVLFDAHDDDSEFHTRTDGWRITGPGAVSGVVVRQTAGQLPMGASLS
jgi:hypothetical protein